MARIATASTVVNAYAATEQGGALTEFQYELGPIGHHEVDIAVDYCGICHSDLSMIDNAWNISQYPIVPGHEVTGKIKARGNLVSHLNVGDVVGLGWHAGYCMTCAACLAGDHNMCGSSAATIVGRHGGFADVVRAHAESVIRLPDGVDPSDAGPLFCGGITVFNPLVQFDVSPTASVGVIGVGGLGHMALRFMKAWGCRVTAFSSSESKRQQLIEMGADDVINSRDADALKAAANRFDMLISTVNVKLDWNGYLGTLKPRGRFHFVGAVLEPLDISVMPLLFGQRSLSASPVGSPANIRRMLDFAARHNIKPVTEHFPMSRVNEALDHLRAGKARYRIVLDRDSVSKS